MPLAPRAAHSALGQRGQHGRAARGVLALRGRHSLGHRLVPPQLDHEPLQQGGHPAGAQPHPALDPRDGRLVAGHERDPQVRAVRLGDRPRRRPTRRPAPASGASGSSASSAGVVVLDDEHVRRPRRGPGAARSARPGEIDGTGRVLRPAGHDDRGDAGSNRTAQTVHCGPLVVDRHGNRLQAERGDEVDQVGPARVLDRRPGRPGAGACRAAARSRPARRR